MPVPKGVDKKKFDDCVEEVKNKQGKKVNAYAVCNASLKGKSMKKSETEETTTTETTASAEPTTPAPEATQVETPPPAPQPKLAAGLFNGFTLGATLKQGPTGNVMTNMKSPMLDYEKTYKQSTKNQVMSAQELEAQSKKKA